MTDLIERLIDEADGYGDGPVVVHDIEGLRALLREAAAALEAKDAEIERLRAERDSFQRVGIAAEARAERLAEALRWYAENVALCRKLGSSGDEGRHALDFDGGRRARAALEQEAGR